MLAAAAVVVFGFLMLEAPRAARNERAQMARGGIEPSGDVYKMMRVAYPAAFVAMFAEGVVRGLPAPLLFGVGALIFSAAKALKWWAILTLGPSWTFRVVVVPGMARVTSGPYRALRHPNYLAVVGELAGVALMCGARITGPIAGAAFALLMLKRIEVENRALGAILRDVELSTTPSSVSPPSARPSPPHWARLVDFICLALVVLAIVIAMFGGFRMRVAGLRLALTSPYRTLAWALAIGVARHFLAPAAPIYQDAPARLALLLRTEAVRTAATVVAATRLPILLVGCLAVFSIGYREGGAPWKLIENNEFVNLQARWDTGWYLGVAIDGYSYVPDRPHDQQNIVFFPAFPILMRVVGRLLGGSSPAFVLGGTAVSLFAFFGALVYLYRFARDVLDDDDAVRWALWMLAAFPFAIFFSAVYTESVFLVGAVAAFYHFRRGELGRASAWGLLVGLARPPGCLVSVPLAVLALSPWLPDWLAGGRRDRRELARPDLRSLVWPMIAAAMPGVGMLLYSAFVWNLTGHPLAWAEGHAAWGREYTGLGVLVTQRYEWLSRGGVYAYASQFPIDALNVGGVVFVLAATWPVARRLGLAYAVFILINILPPLATGGFLSAGRFASVLFPAFVWFSSAVPDRHRPAWLAGFMAIQALNAVLFYTWRPLY